MNLKAVLILGVVLLVGVCKFSNCQAQNKNAAAASGEQSIVFDVNPSSYSDQSVLDSSLLSYSKSTQFGGVEFSLNLSQNEIDSDLDPQYFALSTNSTQIRPQITLFTSESRESGRELNLKNTKTIRSDRYKNTIPAVFRLTLKGYSIMEHSNNQTSSWTLNKVDVKELRKPELMFSFTKKF